jgi:hypothetical protein
MNVGAFNFYNSKDELKGNKNFWGCKHIRAVLAMDLIDLLNQSEEYQLRSTISLHDGRVLATSPLG